MNREENITKLREIISNDPNKPKALARLSFLLVEQSKSLVTTGQDDIENTNTTDALRREAFELAKRSIELRPDKAIGYGALSISSPNFKERMDALKKAIILEKNDTVKESADSAAALAAALVRLLVEPRDQENKGSTAASKKKARRDLSLAEQKLYQETISSLEIAFQRIQSERNEEGKVSRPTSCVANAHYKLGMFFRKLLPAEKHRDAAINHYRSAINLLPNDDAMAETCSFWIGTLSSEKDGSNDADIARCPKTYIVSLYSTFSKKFDDLLVNKLKYETPLKLRELFDRVRRKDEDRVSKCLDLGCGTGLSGLAFSDCTEKMIGVDLSPEMIEKARQRNCYENLFVGDVESICTDIVEFQSYIPFDLVIACDVFVYLGDLRRVFHSVRGNICANGLFAFSTEAIDEELYGEKPFVLHQNARFAHKRSYIESTANDANFVVQNITKTVIRQNNGKAVYGFLVILRPNGNK